MKMHVFSQTSAGDEAYNDNGLVPRTIRLLKDKFPDIVWKKYLFIPHRSKDFWDS